MSNERSTGLKINHVWFILLCETLWYSYSTEVHEEYTEVHRETKHQVYRGVSFVVELFHGVAQSGKTSFF